MYLLDVKFPEINFLAIGWRVITKCHQNKQKIRHTPTHSPTLVTLSVRPKNYRLLRFRWHLQPDALSFDAGGACTTYRQRAPTCQIGSKIESFAGGHTKTIFFGSILKPLCTSTHSITCTRGDETRLKA